MALDTENIINNVTEIFKKGFLVDIGSFIQSNNSEQQTILKYIVDDNCYLLIQRDSWEIFRVDEASQSDKEFAQQLYYTFDGLENGVSFIELPSPSKEFFILVKTDSEQLFSLCSFTNFKDLLQNGLFSDRKLSSGQIVFSSEETATKLYSEYKWISIRQLVEIAYGQGNN